MGAISTAILPPSPQRLYFEVGQSSSTPTRDLEPHALPPWFSLVVAIAIVWGSLWFLEIGRRSH
ncbi:MAG: hypothetical protein SWY16_25580 [Cyanobacteriota bacterium]|nr:hypothetical protein [Cyanobacteriota bacterium]